MQLRDLVNSHKQAYSLSLDFMKENEELRKYGHETVIRQQMALCEKLVNIIDNETVPLPIIYKWFSNVVSLVNVDETQREIEAVK